MTFSSFCNFSSTTLAQTFVASCMPDIVMPQDRWPAPNSHVRYVGVRGRNVCIWVVGCRQAPPCRCGPRCWSCSANSSCPSSWTSPRAWTAWWTPCCTAWRSPTRSAADHRWTDQCSCTLETQQLFFSLLRMQSFSISILACTTTNKFVQHPGCITAQGKQTEVVNTHNTHNFYVVYGDKLVWYCFQALLCTISMIIPIVFFEVFTFCLFPFCKPTARFLSLLAGMKLSCTLSN